MSLAPSLNHRCYSSPEPHALCIALPLHRKAAARVLHCEAHNRTKSLVHDQSKLKDFLYDTATPTSHFGPC